MTLMVLPEQMGIVEDLSMAEKDRRDDHCVSGTGDEIKSRSASLSSRAAASSSKSFSTAGSFLASFANSKMAVA